MSASLLYPARHPADQPVVDAFVQDALPKSALTQVSALLGRPPRDLKFDNEEVIVLTRMGVWRGLDNNSSKTNRLILYVYAYLLCFDHVMALIRSHSAKISVMDAIADPKIFQVLQKDIFRPNFKEWSSANRTKIEKGDADITLANWIGAAPGGPGDHTNSLVHKIVSLAVGIIGRDTAGNTAAAASAAGGAANVVLAGQFGNVQAIHENGEITNPRAMVWKDLSGYDEGKMDNVENNVNANGDVIRTIRLAANSSGLRSYMDGKYMDLVQQYYVAQEESNFRWANDARKWEMGLDWGSNRGRRFNCGPGYMPRLYNDKQEALAPHEAFMRGPDGRPAYNWANVAYWDGGCQKAHPVYGHPVPPLNRPIPMLPGSRSRGRMGASVFPSVVDEARRSVLRPHKRLPFAADAMLLSKPKKAHNEAKTKKRRRRHSSVKRSSRRRRV